MGHDPDTSICNNSENKENCQAKLNRGDFFLAGFGSIFFLSMSSDPTPDPDLAIQ